MFIKIYNWLTSSNYQNVKKRYNHKVNADIAFVPIGNQISISKDVRKVGEIIAKAGFQETNVHGFGTNVSGDLQKLFKTIEKISQTTLAEPGTNRISLNVKLSMRRDKEQSIKSRLAAVN